MDFKNFCSSQIGIIEYTIYKFNNCIIYVLIIKLTFYEVEVKRVFMGRLYFLSIECSLYSLNFKSIFSLIYIGKEFKASSKCTSNKNSFLVSFLQFDILVIESATYFSSNSKINEYKYFKCKSLISLSVILRRGSLPNSF